MEEVYIFGAGGHARVVSDIIQCQGKYKISALVTPDGQGTGNHPIISEEQALEKPKPTVVALGDNFLRSQIVQKLTQAGINQFITCVHPSAVIANSVTLGSGTVVMAGAVINPEVKVGAHCILNTACSIDHDGRMEDYASLGPGSHLGGEVRLGRSSSIGLGAQVIQKVEIGQHTVVGAGTLVVKSLPSHILAYGHPCQVVRPRQENEPYLS